MGDGDKAAIKTDTVVEDEKADLSEEDKLLQEELNLCVERLQENDELQYVPALKTLGNQIRASTTSMTSVPKPLKFMRPHYGTMKQIYDKLTNDTIKIEAADVISVLAMTMGEGVRECLKYRLLSNLNSIGEWGHEYVRHLAGEIAQEWGDINGDTENEADLKDKLIRLAKQIVPYNMSHNAEAEACDLLMEIERLDLLQQFVDENIYNRVCLYLTSCVPYVADPENTTLLKTALMLFRKFEQYPQALRLAMQLNDHQLIEEIFTSCSDTTMQKQLAFMLGRQQIFIDINESTPEYDDLIEIMANCHLNNHFLNLARELDIMEPKTPEDVYKSHLENTRPQFGGGQVDSARQNLAASFVNGFVNAAFGQDKLLMEDGNKWLFKNKEHGMLSATASLGLVLLWDVDGGLTPIDKYLYSSEDHIKSGALLACGIVNCGVRNECDPALALLSDYVLHNTNIMRLGAIVGLGLAYVGSNREAVLSLLTPVFTDAKSNMEVVGMAGLACGMIAVGSGNPEVTSTIIQTLLERPESDLKDTYARFLPLGLGLCYLGRQEEVEAVVATLEVIPEPFKSMAITMVEVCAYAGTGNVLKIQQLLHICSEHYEPEKDDKGKDKNKDKDENYKDLSSKQAIAVLGIALISMGEDIGGEMAFRTFGHLLRYCEPVIRRAVPLALGLISVSNPKLGILDTLSKFSHDSDSEVAHNAIFAMGLVGAGTNNARLAAMLRQLAQFHAKDPNNLFMVRIAQGLTHLGKGTLSLSPYHSDRQLLSPVAVAGLMATLVGFLDVKNIILGRSHYLLYTLAAAMQPRMLVTFDEELNPLAVPVRVGLAVDVVGQAGKPKTITGFQTHTTPVLLAFGERAELATEEYNSLTPIMEGFVILRKNPEFNP
ncbi:PREDICTED: 26S proteasome non-ATPase regulatory subunit 2 [Nicrophorus vespilloides]|uniref:26S proteasome non-ATPase regulatory subunit 2 n=1 Tax=Nicrophorus vespilloides TaxID=110193 RepID=A0ABM1MBG9_NICVS|nr:PREDICTED: 26S proteasome non-ATPase regulatory subunit 2 [Nicrophorus vespilloides]XP_017771919.1 PREDICTED: 26S proteasome non-ATPase regulatory subunit 2 [Nicrophorus vespilloides]XP_017771920.1 PREDICTED: 26S proteasome non-ATPase regulatory subunit 2 [Nicrophorus vespilloides]